MKKQNKNKLQIGWHIDRHDLVLPGYGVVWNHESGSANV